MIEILFRAWDSDKKKMIGPFSFGSIEYCNDTGGTYIDGDRIFFHCAELMQFTGLLDKNGKKIFEGDIVRGRYTSDMGALNTIKWGDSGFCVYGEAADGYKAGFALSQSEALELEVIGTIHDK